MTLINFSEFNTLAQCEMKHVYAYLLNLEEEGAKKGLHLGTLCHIWYGNWLLGKGAYIPDQWTDDINTGGKPGEVRTLRCSDFDPDLVARALWLRERFVEFYGEAPPSHWHVLSSEEWLTRDFPWGTLVGRSDGMVEIDGQLVLLELKTYGQRPGPLAYAQVSPQLGCYSLLAEQKYGRRPDAVLMQGIYTYRWVPTKPTLTTLKGQIGLEWAPGRNTTKEIDAEARRRQADPNNWTERDPSESFDQIEVELGDDHLRTAELYLASGIERREQLAAGAHPIPNVGRDCSWCGFKPRCWSALGGVEEFEIELDEDESEPV